MKMLTILQVGEEGAGVCVCVFVIFIIHEFDSICAQVMHMLEKESSIAHSLHSNSLGTSEVLQEDSSGCKKPVDTSWLLALHVWEKRKKKMSELDLRCGIFEYLLSIDMYM
jgi:hypothetical protein